MINYHLFRYSKSIKVYVACYIVVYFIVLMILLLHKLKYL